jgi:hypothetical protein
VLAVRAPFPDRARPLAQAVDRRGDPQHEAYLEKTLPQSVGDATIAEWGRQLAAPEGEHGSLQQWLWAVPLKHSTVQMAELFDKIDQLYALKVAAAWPVDVNETLVRHYARRCANRPPSVSKRIQS